MSFIRSHGLMIFLCFILIFLQYRLWFEPGGLTDMLKLKHQLANQVALNDSLKKRNALLLTQVNVLQKNPETLERRAREELGMIKQNETFYQVVTSEKK